MLPSFHDDYLVGYQVDCEGREIKLQIKPATWTTNVEAYDFEHDAFGNIIFAIEAVPAQSFLSNHQDDLAKMNRMSGVPGKWASNPDAATTMAERGLRAFAISSSLGLSGWIVARNVFVVPPSAENDV